MATPRYLRTDDWPDAVFVGQLIREFEGRGRLGVPMGTQHPGGYSLAASTVRPYRGALLIRGGGSWPELPWLEVNLELTYVYITGRGELRNLLERLLAPG